jgi:hypothetical protein
MSKLDDLIIYKASLDKETNEDKIISILNKLKLEFSDFTIDDFLKSKIGKTLKVISDLKNKFNWVDFDSTSNIQISDTGVQMLK